MEFHRGVAVAVLYAGDNVEVLAVARDSSIFAILTNHTLPVTKHAILLTKLKIIRQNDRPKKLQLMKNYALFARIIS